MLQRMAVLQFILYVTTKRRGVRRVIPMKFIGGRLESWEKVKWRNLRDWIKSKMKTYMLLLHW